MKKLLIIPVIIFSCALIYFGYVAYSAYVTSDYEAVGFFVCNPDKTICENSQHIHADIEVIDCGKNILFEKEKGRTDQQHTHKEQNKIHWHARERVDPVTREPLDKSPRQLRAFFTQMAHPFRKNCEGNTKEVDIKLFVNDIPEPLGLYYVWKDGDKLKLVVE